MARHDDHEPPPIGPNAPAGLDPIPTARKIDCPVEPAIATAPRPMLLLQSSRQSIAGDLALFLVLAIMAAFILPGLLTERFWTVFGQPIAPEIVTDDLALGRRIFFPVMIMRGVAALLVVWAMLAVRRQSFGSIGLSRGRFWGHVGVGILATGACFLMTWTWLLLIFWVWPDLAPQAGENVKRLLERVPRMGIGSMFLVAVLVGWYEEVLFRGFLMTRLRRLTGSWTLGVALSATIFTLPHMYDQTPVMMVVVGSLALIFSLTTIWRRSIIPAIVGHALFDFCQFIGLFYVAAPASTP